MLKRLLCAFVIAAPTVVSAQTTVSVTFPAGVIGTIGSNTGQANDVVNIGNIGITSVTFSQLSTTGAFGDPVGTQGNDFCGTLTLVGSGIAPFDACVNWRQTSGALVNYIGFIPAPSTSINTALDYTGPFLGFGETYTIIADPLVNAAAPESNFLLKVRTAAANFSDGSDVSGNAAAASALDALNDYLDSVSDTTLPRITGPNNTTNADTGVGTDQISVLEGTTDVETFVANENVAWTLDGTDAALFEIDEFGNLTFVNAPVFDAETPENNVYVVDIVATDLAGNEAILTFRVTVTDATKPEITGPTAGTTDGEGADEIEVPEGTTEVTQFTSNEDVAWTLDGTEAGLFDIDEFGNLTFVNAPVFDAETPENNVYEIEIVATDDAGNVAILTFTVRVTDATKPEITGPTAGTTDGLGEDEIEVAEGTTEVTQFTSNEDVAWTLDGTDAGLFEIDEFGNLTFVNAPVFDAETPENNVYVVDIVATDDAGNVAILTFTVTVTDATKPEITGPTDGTTDGEGSDAIEVAEGTTEVTQFTAGEEVEWSVGGPDAGQFDIDDEGNLSFVNAPVFDPQNPANNVYEIEIIATDPAGNAAVLTFTITVTDTALAALNRNRDDIEAIIAEVELQKLRAEQRSLRKMTSQARDRLAGGACGEEEEEGGASANDEACQDYNRTRMNGQANDDGMTLSGSNASMATFDGYRRLTSLTIDMARNDRVETLTFSGRFALESTRFDNALYGVFVGAKMNSSDVNRRLSGDVKSWGLSFGAYAVNRLSSNVYSEAYLSVGRSKTDLALGIAAEDFTVDADYTGTELHGGWILSGVVERGDWEFLPEVGVQLAQSKTGPISVAAAIPGDTATDTWAGLTVSMARANVATDIRYHLGGKADDSWVANFKPGIVCERTKAIETRSGCGASAQLGLNYHSADGMTRFSAGVDVERIKTDDRASMGMDVEFRF
jgi:hypothetical protein